MSADEYNVTGLAARRVGLRLLLWLALGAWFLSDALAHPYATGGAPDWTYFGAHHEGAYKTYAEYGQFPAWDPYSCGGIPGVGNVQNNAASPSFLLTLLFGLGPGLKIGWLVLFLLGLEGTYQYARHRGSEGFGALLAAAAFCFCGRFAMPMLDGQPAFLGFLMTPWVLLGFEKGVDDFRWTAAGGLALAWVFCEGGAIATPMVVVVLVFLLLYHLAARLGAGALRPTWYRPIVAFVLLGAIGAGACAMRTLPVLDSLLHHPRLWQAPEGYAAEHILRMLFERTTDGGYAGPGTTYVGLPVLGLLAFAVVLRDRVGILLGCFAACCVALAMGTGGPLHLYDAVRRLPFLSNLRCPFRYTYFAALYVALGGGRGLTLLEHHLLRLGERIKERRIFDRLRGSRTAFTVLTVLAVAAATGWIGYQEFRNGPRFTFQRIAHVFGRPAPLVLERRFAQSMGDRWSADVWPAANLGDLRCFEEQPFPVSPALRGDLAQEEYLADPGAGTVREVSWSPERIELDVDLARPATVLVNQNAHRGWTVSAPGRIVAHDGLLAALLPAGRRRVVFDFDDPLTNLGFVVAVLTWALVALWLVRSWLARRPRRGTDGGSAGPVRGGEPRGEVAR